MYKSPQHSSPPIHPKTNLYMIELHNGHEWITWNGINWFMKARILHYLSLFLNYLLKERYSGEYGPDVFIILHFTDQFRWFWTVVYQPYSHQTGSLLPFSLGSEKRQFLWENYFQFGSQSQPFGVSIHSEMFSAKKCIKPPTLPNLS